MIHTKKWMVVPYESDDEIDTSILNDTSMSDYDRVRKFEALQVKKDHKLLQKSTNMTVDNNKDMVIKPEHEEMIVEDANEVEKVVENKKNKKKTSKTKKNIEKEHKKTTNKNKTMNEALRNMTESFYQRAPALNTRQNIVKLSQKRKLDRSHNFNASRMNNSRINDTILQGINSKKPKIGVKKKDDEKKILRYSRLDDNDVELMDDDDIFSEDLYKEKVNDKFGNISEIM